MRGLLYDDFLIVSVPFVAVAVPSELVGRLQPHDAWPPAVRPDHQTQTLSDPSPADGCTTRHIGSVSAQSGVGVVHG